MSVGWSEIISHWRVVCLDLHEHWGCDWEGDLPDQRSWWWVHDRIVDLVDKPSRLRSALGLAAHYTTNTNITT